MAELLKATGIYYRNELRSIHKNGVKLQPVYEAFTNSWESILEKYTAEHLNLGSIVIEFHYNAGVFEEDNENNLKNLQKIIITDNGIGLNEESFTRLLNLRDNSKSKNNKGTGRIQYLQRIYYYLCASHAHLGDEAFFELRDKLNEYEKVFLHGIYYRKRKRYDKAEAKFREALNIYPNSYTAKNELAIALQRQGRYLDALHVAKEAYNAQPNNAFYIVTYFKSLVRDVKTEEYVLKELIDKLRSAWDTNREIFSLMLEAEYEYYRNNDFNAAMTLFKRALEINNFQPIFISASEICSIENRFDIYEDLAKKYHYND